MGANLANPLIAERICFALPLPKQRFYNLKELTRLIKAKEQ